MKHDESFWTQRYQQNQTGWDLGTISPPLKAYIDQLERKEIKILIPGSGNSYEATYLFNNGFSQVYILDISQYPLKIFKENHPDFPADQLLHHNFFDLEMKFDLILEQTFFCALDPELRSAYASKMAELLKPQGKLVGVMFDAPMNSDRPPYGGTQQEYRKYFKPFFNFKTFEPCYNSIAPRQGLELFINLIKK